MSARATTIRRCSRSTFASATKTGTVNAARPEVAGTAKAVATNTVVSRWNRTRTLDTPVTMKTAPRVARPELVTPAEITKAASSNQTVSSPSEEKSLSVGKVPIITSSTAAPSAT